MILARLLTLIVALQLLDVGYRVKSQNMEQVVNIPAIAIADIAGFMLLAITFICYRWQFKDKSIKNNAIRGMIIVTMSACIVDLASCWSNGQSGPLFYWINFIGNEWVFFTNLLLGPFWTVLIISHLELSFTRRRQSIVAAALAIGAIPLVLNWFIPLVFSIDPSTNNYVRGPLYWLYIVFEGCFIVDGCVIYLTYKYKNAFARSFPIAFLGIPILVGIIIQSAFYGVSTIWPCGAIGICGVVMSLQNEKIYCDGLTGIYNRAYFDHLVGKANSIRANPRVTAMMLDLDSFKNINDMFGHAEGDQALISVSKILSKAIGSNGTVIRYAGDEFVVILSTQSDQVIDKCLQAISYGFRRFNETSGKEYQLSVSIGYAKVNLKTQTIDDIMNKVDALMYQNKRAHYAARNA